MQIVPAHSKVGPSKSHRWIHCPASVQASEGCPDKCNDAASLGTAAHLLGEMTIEKGFRCPSLWEYPEKVEGKKGKLHEVDQEMIDAVSVYTSYVFNMRQEGDDVKVEERFHLGRIHPDLFGTNDCMILRPMEYLHVIDYKNGSGQLVEIVEDEDVDVGLGYSDEPLETVCLYPPLEKVNPQLLIYALGGLNSTPDPFLTVKLTIVQPRCEHPEWGPIRSVILRAQDIRNWGEKFLKPAVEKCYAEDPEYRIGSWCKFCPAIACKAKLTEAFAMVKAENPIKKPDVTFPLPEHMTPQELLAVSTFANHFKSWAEDVTRFIKHQLETGKMTSAQLGLKLVEGRKTKKWKGDYEGTLLDTFPMVEKGELYNEPKPKSPAQVKTLLKEEHGFSGKELDNRLKPAYTEQPGNPRLVHVSAKGAELKPKAAVAFEQFDKEIKTDGKK